MSKQVEYKVCYLTDGTDKVNLVAQRSGICITESRSELPDLKGRGVWIDSQFREGRRLILGVLSNSIETMTLRISAESQDDIITQMQALARMLNKARNYWTDPNAIGTSPVYLVARGMYESGIKYATVFNWSWPDIEDPYHPPFGNYFKPTVEMQLVLERSMWYNALPGTGSAVTLDNPEIYKAINADVTISPAAGNHDAEADNTPPGFFNLTGINIATGVISPPNTRDGLFLFPALLINPLNELDFAEITVTCGISSPTRGKFDIYGQLSLNPAVFVNYADYIARPTTIEYLPVDNSVPSAPSWNAGDTQAYDVIDILQEIIDQVGWASGNNVAFFFQGDSSVWGTDKIAAFENVVYNQPSLHVRTKTDVDIGLSSDEKDRIFSTNRHHYGQINYIWNYDLSLGTYTQLFGTALPWTLFPNPVGVGDMLYFGIVTSTAPALQLATIHNLVFNLTTALNDITYTWEYYDGVAVGWIAVANDVDHTNGFTELGLSTYHRVGVATEASVAVNGVTAIWLRATVTGVGAAPVNPVQSTYTIWEPNNNYIEVSASDTGGEYQPKTKLSINPLSGDASTALLGIDQLWIGRRSYDRGANFTAYLPTETTWLPDNCAIVFGGGYVAGIAGRCSYNRLALRFFTGGAVAELKLIEWQITGDLAAEYPGQYHCFLRRYGVTNPENCSYRLVVSSQLVTVSPDAYSTDVIADTTNPDTSLIDFGIISLPATASAIAPEQISLQVYAQCSAATDTFIYDLILIPVDEWSANIYQQLGTGITKVNGYRGTEVVIDNLNEDGETRAYYENGGVKIADLMIDKSGGEILTFFKRQRLWFLAGNTTGSSIAYQRFYPCEDCYSIYIELRKQFMTLRGNA